MARHSLRILRVLGSTLLILLGILVLLFERVDRTPYTDQPYYAQVQPLVDSLSQRYHPATGRPLQVGWSRKNITPDQPAHLMGYGWKGDYERVHDSLEVRVLVFQLDSLSVGVVSYDLMLAPPAVVRQVTQDLTSLPVDHLYFTAVHTHNGYGSWAEGLGREVIAGFYDPRLVQQLVQQTKAAVEQAAQQLLPVQIAYSQFRVDSLVNNRLVKGGAVEPYLRALYLQRADGSRALLCSYSAHATFLSSRSHDLSADYPGELVRQLESDPRVAFAMYAAGAVGSHSPHKPAPFSYQNLQDYAGRLTTPILQALDHLTYDSVSRLGFSEVPLPLPPPQLRISENWRIRPYWFKALMGNQVPFLSFLQVGNVTLVGTPGDFSGLLYDQIWSNGQPLMVTSFNGEYIGYLIPSRYYGINHRETRITNWFGPGTGDYVVDVINQVLPRLSSSRPARPD